MKNVLKRSQCVNVPVGQTPANELAEINFDPEPSVLAHKIINWTIFRFPGSAHPFSRKCGSK